MSRVALDLGFIQIYWYSIMIALGLFVGVSVILYEGRRKKIAEDFLKHELSDKQKSNEIIEDRISKIKL